MKKIICITIILIGTLCSCLTDKKNSREITADMIDNPSKIEFEDSEFNFGKMAVGSSIEHSFTFKNTGDTPLLIHSVKAQCGCTIPENWPKHPILPGEEGEIEVEFNPKSPNKKERKYIAVIANTRPATTKLYLTGEVKGN